MVLHLEESKKMIFAKKLKALFDDWKENHPGFTQEMLGKAVNAERVTVNGWLHGKTYPSGSYLDSLCEFFSVPPTYFDSTEEELIYTDEQRHKDLDQLCRRSADHVGLSESFVRFIKENPALADLVIAASWVNPVVNPPDSNVPETDSPYQFTSSTGVRIYLPDEVIFMLRCVQRDLEEYAGFLIRKYSQPINNYYRPAAGQDRVSPLSVFARDLDGMSALSPDETSIVSIMRLMDDKGRIELAKQAAHIVHRQRKQSRIPDIDAMIAEEGGEK